MNHHAHFNIKTFLIFITYAFKTDSDSQYTKKAGGIPPHETLGGCGLCPIPIVKILSSKIVSLVVDKY